MSKKQIIAIGGGSFNRSHSANNSIEKYILKQAGKDSPKICFLAQASNEDKGYIVNFYQTFSQLGAQPSWVSLFGRVESTWQNHLLQQDIIFVGGGNTKSMLALWHAWGLDSVLKEAYENGIILCGVSAGAICWFQQGITDSVWPIGVLECMSILKGSCCPHYDSEIERKPIYTDAVAKQQALPGIALSDYTAAHYIDGTLSHALAWQPDRNVYLVTEVGQTQLTTISI